MEQTRQLRRAPVPHGRGLELTVGICCDDPSDFRIRRLHAVVSERLPESLSAKLCVGSLQTQELLGSAGVSVCLIDERLGLRELSRTIRSIRDLNPRCAVIVLAEDIDIDVHARYWDYGAAEVLLWDEAIDPARGDYHLYRAMRGAVSRAGLLVDLKAMKARFDFAWRRAPAPFFRVEAGGNIIGCNDAFAELLGFPSANDLIGKPLLEMSDGPEGNVVPFRPSDDGPRSRCLRTRSGDGVVVELVDHEAPGDHREILQIAKIGGPAYSPPIREGYVDSNGAATSELKRQLARYESIYASLFAAMAQGFLVADARGRIRSCNPAAEAMLGVSLRDIHDRHLDEVLRPRTGSDERAHFFSEIYDGNERLFELPARTECGEEDPEESIWIRAKALLVEVPGRDGVFLRSQYLISLLDETARVDAEQRASKAELGSQIAAGISHDMRNFLTAIASSASLMKKMLVGQDPALLKYAEQIEHVALGSAGILDQGVRVARSRSLSDHRIVEVDSTLNSIDRLLRSLLPKRVELLLTTGAGGGRVATTAGALEQIVINLVLNSREALGNEGSVEVTTTTVDLDEDNEWGMKPTGAVVLCVTDDGPGIPDEIRARMFEPFFTGRADGTGLGLAMVRELVHELGGRVRCETAPGEGASFRIALPLVPEVEEAPASSDPAPA